MCSPRSVCEVGGVPSRSTGSCSEQLRVKFTTSLLQPGFVEGVEVEVVGRQVEAVGGGGGYDIGGGAGVGVNGLGEAGCGGGSPSSVDRGSFIRWRRGGP